MENHPNPLLAEFEKRSGNSRDEVDVVAFLAEYPDASARQIVDILLVDQYKKWQTGQCPAVEEYVRAFPNIVNDESALVELVAEEFGYSEQQSSTAGATQQEVDQFVARFSMLSSDAVERLRVMIGPVADDAAATNSVSVEPVKTQNVPTPDKIARFKIEGLLGRGSFGVVYRAYDEELQRAVAIKVPARIRIDQAGGVDAFMKEARVVASLDHPAIVPIYDVGKAAIDGEEKVYLVTKFVDGQDLKWRIKQGVSVSDTSRMIATVARALHYAHGQGLVHRDVKPGNILIDRENAPHVVDFGLALKEEEFGRGVKLVGTPAYMSPEQALGKGHRVDGRSDVFSLGVVLYEMLTGRRPHRGESASEILEQIRHDDVRPPRQINDQLPIELERICLKALARNPSDRYTTALDFSKDLEQFSESPDATDAIPYRTASMTHRSLTSDSTPTIAVGATESDGKAVGTVASKSSWSESSNAAIKWAIAIGIVIVTIGLTLYLVNASGMLSGNGNNIAKNNGDDETNGGEEEIIDGARVTFTTEEIQQRQKESAEAAGVDIEFASPRGLQFMLIPPGIFEMGSDRSEIDLLPLDDWFFKRWQRQRMYNESPRRRVQITRPFYLGSHEITIEQFREFVEDTDYQTTAEKDPEGGFGWDGLQWIQSPEYNWKNVGFYQSDSHPVGNVSWIDATEFCAWLSEEEKAVYRLPTEAEWEYACRAGTSTWFFSGDRDEGLKNLANIADQSLSEINEAIEWGRPWNDGFPYTAPVGSFQPNAFGLHDMHGNVWEWCHDWYSRSYYGEQVNIDPQGPALEDMVATTEIETDDQGRQFAEGEYRVFRGGGWDNYPGFCRSSDRYSSHSPEIRTNWAGFRVVKEIE